MKNLENYGVLEMDATEIREIDGGVVWYVWVAAAVAADIVMNPVSAWESLKEGFLRGYNQE